MKQVIILESDQEYLAYALSKKEVELDGLCAKFNNINYSVVFLESSILKKEDLTRALGDKLSLCENDLAHLSSAVYKMMTGSQKLNEILSSAKYFGDKR